VRRETTVLRSVVEMTYQFVAKKKKDFFLQMEHEMVGDNAKTERHKNELTNQRRRVSHDLS